VRKALGCLLWLAAAGASLSILSKMDYQKDEMHKRKKILSLRSTDSISGTGFYKCSLV
jgi:hypothetical protein